MLEAEDVLLIEIEVNPLTVGKDAVGFVFGAVDNPFILNHQLSHREEVVLSPRVLIHIIDVNVNSIASLSGGLKRKVPLTLRPPLRTIETTQPGGTGGILDLNVLADMLAGT